MIIWKDNLANYFLMNTIHDALESASMEADWTTTTCITDSLHAQFTLENMAKKVVFLEQRKGWLLLQMYTLSVHNVSIFHEFFEILVTK